MFIEELQLRHFRNVEQAHITVQGAQSIVLQGNNAQGKSNVLEAMYLVATGRSFRAATSGQMLMHAQPAGSVAALLQRQDVRHRLQISLRPQGRSITLDGRHLRQVTQLLDTLNLVAFFPEDLNIAKGSPEQRRRFFDRATANSQRGFAAASIAYHKALTARNALLKRPPGEAAQTRQLLAAFEPALLQYGSHMQQARLSWLQRITPHVQAHFKALLPQTKSLRMQLHSGMELPEHCAESTSQAPIAAAFAQSLQRSRRRDLQRGMTCVGPHRADLQTWLDGVDIRYYASQGQQRVLVLALKLAEVISLTEQLGVAPILLLDDVSSELDTARTERLFAVLQQVRSQVWVSTTGAVRLPLRGAHTAWFKLHAGSIEPYEPGPLL